MLFLLCCRLEFHETRQQLDASLHMQSVYTRLAAHAIEIKASWSQMGLFVLNTHFKIASTPSAPLAPSSALADGIGSPWWCALLSPAPLGFPYANKDWYLSSHLTWLGEIKWQDNIRAAISKVAERFQAEESGRMLWICHTGCSNSVQSQNSPVNM